MNIDIDCKKLNTNEIKTLLKDMAPMLGSFSNKCFPAAYILRHVQSGYIYIGSTKDILNRYRQHIYDLTISKRANPNLLRVWDSYDKKDLEVYVFPAKDYKAKEQELLDLFVGNKYLCNVHISAYGGTGVPRPLGVVQRCREAMIERYKDTNNRAKTGDAIRKAYAEHPEYREKVSKRMKERRARPEVIKFYSNLHKERWKNKEFREKVLKGMKIAFNKPEYREKISKIVKEHRNRPGAREHMSRIQKERFKNPDVIARYKQIHEEQKELFGTPIIINKVRYPSTREASRLLFIPKSTIRSRLKNNKFPNYQYA